MVLAVVAVSRRRTLVAAAGAALSVGVLMLVGLRRGSDPARLLLLGSLALAGAFIVFNKVGSPVTCSNWCRSWSPERRAPGGNGGPLPI